MVQWTFESVKSGLEVDASEKIKSAVVLSCCWHPTGRLRCYLSWCRWLCCEWMAFILCGHHHERMDKSGHGGNSVRCTYAHCAGIDAPTQVMIDKAFPEINDVSTGAGLNASALALVCSAVGVEFLRGRPVPSSFAKHQPAELWSSLSDPPQSCEKSYHSTAIPTSSCC